LAKCNLQGRCDGKRSQNRMLAQHLLSELCRIKVHLNDSCEVKKNNRIQIVIARIIYNAVQFLIVQTHSDPSLLGRNKHILVLQKLSQRTILVHRHQDIGSTNKLLVDVQLWYRRPVRVLLDTCDPSVFCPTYATPPHLPALSSSSSRTLNAVNF